MLPRKLITSPHLTPPQDLIEISKKDSGAVEGTPHSLAFCFDLQSPSSLLHSFPFYFSVLSLPTPLLFFNGYG